MHFLRRMDATAQSLVPLEPRGLHRHVCLIISGVPGLLRQPCLRPDVRHHLNYILGVSKHALPHPGPSALRFDPKEALVIEQPLFQIGQRIRVSSSIERFVGVVHCCHCLKAQVLLLFPRPLLTILETLILAILRRLCSSFP